MKKKLLLLLLLMLLLFYNRFQLHSRTFHFLSLHSQRIQNIINNYSINLDALPNSIYRYIILPLENTLEYSSQNTGNFHSSINETFFSFKGIHLGSSLEDVLNILGKPKRVVLSEYGFKWYIYHDNYWEYLQVGLQDNKVVALYSNWPCWINPFEINIGTRQEVVMYYFNPPIDHIIKGNVTYLLPEERHYHVYKEDHFYLTVFFDIHDHQKVTALQLIDRKVEEGYHHGNYTIPELKKSFELQIFDLTNTVRVRYGLSPLIWDEKASASAYKHSMDMAKRNYFSHENLQGDSPFDRMKREGILYQKAGENIAAGQQNPIFAHEGWMNSLSHRQAILEDFERLGVGVWLDGPLKTYYTQNFYTPRSVE